MNLRFCIICTAVLLALVAPVSLTLGMPFFTENNITATIHGASYADDTLEPLNDTVIDINSNPPQSIVAKNGTYSFELVPGNYIITARCYRNNMLIYSKETTLKVEDNGNYVFDLLLNPVSKNQVTETAAKIDNLYNEGSAEHTSSNSSEIWYILVALILFLLLGGGYKLSRKVLRGSTGPGAVAEPGTIGADVSVRGSEIEPADNSETDTAAHKKTPLPTDLLEILEIIRGNRSRITQKDLRSKLDYSEVKVSLLLSDLEKRGLIKKFKNGRENIVVLVDEKHSN